MSIQVLLFSHITLNSHFFQEFPVTGHPVYESVFFFFFNIDPTLFFFLEDNIDPVNQLLLSIMSNTSNNSTNPTEWSSFVLYVAYSTGF